MKNILLLLSLVAALASAAAKKPPPKGKPATNQATLLVDAQGLRADSNRKYAIYQDNRCVKVARIGAPTPMPPGKYNVHVGFQRILFHQSNVPGKFGKAVLGVFREFFKCPGCLLCGRHGHQWHGHYHHRDRRPR